MNLPAVVVALRQLADAFEAEMPAPAGDGLLTISQVADRLHRSPSTVRGWAEDGRFAGAFKLNGKDWRLPTGALTAFLAGQRAQDAPQATITTRADTRVPRPRARKGAAADLGAWRQEPQTGRAA